MIFYVITGFLLLAFIACVCYAIFEAGKKSEVSEIITKDLSDAIKAAQIRAGVLGANDDKFERLRDKWTR